jgi:hypothetical protein
LRGNSQAPTKRLGLLAALLLVVVALALLYAISIFPFLVRLWSSGDIGLLLESVILQIMYILILSDIRSF